MQHYAEQYKAELLENIVPFWLRHSRDRELGGYYSCLDPLEMCLTTNLFGCKVGKCGRSPRCTIPWKRNRNGLRWQDFSVCISTQKKNTRNNPAS